MTADPAIAEIAERIRSLREMCGYTVEEMSEAMGTTPEEYMNLESGSSDFGFTFLYRCARRLGVDIIELLTGRDPKLEGFSVVRTGEGLPIRRREGFSYFHLAPAFRSKIAEPFLVIAPYRADEQGARIALSSHEGQEMDYVLSGTMRFCHDGRTVDVGPGDTLYYDSGKSHGMFATSEQGCVFLAIVMNRGTGQ